MSHLFPPPPATRYWWEDNADKVECPHCHAVLDVTQECDCAGADDGCVFCAACHQEFEL